MNMLVPNLNISVPNSARAARTVRQANKGKKIQLLQLAREWMLLSDEAKQATHPRNSFRYSVLWREDLRISPAHAVAKLQRVRNRAPAAES